MNFKIYLQKKQLWHYKQDKKLRNFRYTIQKKTRYLWQIMLAKIYFYYSFHKLLQVFVQRNYVQ